jgi:hypothetical protein
MAILDELLEPFAKAIPREGHGFEPPGADGGCEAASLMPVRVPSAD